MSATTTQTMTIRIPDTPSRELSPNRSRTRHWGGHHRAKSVLEWATFAGIKAGNVGFFTGEPPISVSITVAWEKGRKRMDADNLLASLKACIDTIALNIGVDDKHFRFAPIEQRHDPEGRGYMIVVLEASS